MDCVEKINSLADVESLPLVKELRNKGFDLVVDSLKKFVDYTGRTVFHEYTSSDIQMDNFLSSTALQFIFILPETSLMLAFFISNQKEKQTTINIIFKLLLENGKLDRVFDFIVNSSKTLSKKFIYCSLYMIINKFLDLNQFDRFENCVKLLGCLKNNLPLENFKNFSDKNIISVGEGSLIYISNLQDMLKDLLTCKEEEIYLLCIYISDIYSGFSQFDRSEKILKELLELTNYENNKQKIEIWFKLGNIHFLKENFKIALNLYDTILRFKNIDIDNTNEIKVYRNIGTCYGKLNNKKQEQFFYKKSLKCSETPSLEKARTLDCIGEFYIKTKITKSFSFYNLAFEMRKTLVNEGKLEYNSIDMAMSLNNMGICFKHQDCLDKSIEYFKESNRIWKTLPWMFKINTAVVYMNLVSIYMKQEEQEENTQKILNCFYKSNIVRLDYETGLNFFEHIW
jgi:tetratricopeptide (TPR) repeat protein